MRSNRYRSPLQNYEAKTKHQHPITEKVRSHKRREELIDATARFVLSPGPAKHAHKRRTSYNRNKTTRSLNEIRVTRASISVLSKGRRNGCSHPLRIHEDTQAFTTVDADTAQEAQPPPLPRLQQSSPHKTTNCRNHSASNGGRLIRRSSLRNFGRAKGQTQEDNDQGIRTSPWNKSGTRVVPQQQTRGRCDTSSKAVVPKERLSLPVLRECT